MASAMKLYSHALLQIRAGSASSRRKRESSLRCKISIFSLVKAARPNSWQRTRPAECRCWSSTTGHALPSRSRSAAILSGFIPSLICSGATCANKRTDLSNLTRWHNAVSSRPSAKAGSSSSGLNDLLRVTSAARSFAAARKAITLKVMDLSAAWAVRCA